jgi:hypothetical protein
MDRDQTPDLFALLTPEAVALPALEGDDDMASRRCVRCRVVFEDLPILDIQGRRGKDWSLCASCQAIAFPKRSRSSATLTIVPLHTADQDGSHPS